MSDLTKPPNDNLDQNYQLNKGKLTSKTSSFKSRLRDEQARREAVTPETMPNRICLMLDCSGSMREYESIGTLSGDKRRIDLLKDAVQNFVSRCSFDDTSVAIATFPGRTDKALPLSCQSSQIVAYSVGLEPSGNTPLQNCVVRCLTDIPMTRGVIVSDGGATDWLEGDVEDSFDVDSDLEAHKTTKTGKNTLKLYKEQHIPLDCVHISSSTDGEALLRRIAQETGGIFIKFSDVNAFSKAFGYLTPSHRAMLTSGSISAAELGAKEIK